MKQVSENQNKTLTKQLINEHKQVSKQAMVKYLSNSSLNET